MITIASFIITICFLVFIHEYGHYFVAKYYNVKIEEFSIGFGKELFARTDRNGVRWKICLIPLGGFVKMFKDENHLNNKQKNPEEFYAHPAYQRLLIIMAGPFANFLLAAVILTGFYSFHGKFVTAPIIEHVIKNSPAEEAGLISGDKIIKLRDKAIIDFSEFKQNLILHPSLPVNLTIERNNQLINIVITSYIYQESNPIIGIKSRQGNIVSIGFFESCYLAVYDIRNISLLTLKMLGQMVVGSRSSQDMHGVITIAKESANSLNKGFSNYLIFLAMISINLGLVNILPIPILDGGHLLFTVYEIIARKPLSGYLQNIFNKIGLAIIIFLIIISTTNDIKNLL